MTLEILEQKVMTRLEKKNILAILIYTIAKDHAMHTGLGEHNHHFKVLFSVFFKPNPSVLEMINRAARQCINVIM